MYNKFTHKNRVYVNDKFAYNRRMSYHCICTVLNEYSVQ